MAVATACPGDLLQKIHFIVIIDCDCANVTFLAWVAQSSLTSAVRLGLLIGEEGLPQPRLVRKRPTGHLK